MAALKASRLVWLAISPITLMISDTRTELAWMALIEAMDFCSDA